MIRRWNITDREMVNRVDPWFVTGLTGWPLVHDFHDWLEDSPDVIPVQGCAAKPKPVCHREDCLQRGAGFREGIGKEIWWCGSCCVTQFPGVYESYMEK